MSEGPGISPWFRVGYTGMTHTGIEVTFFGTGGEKFYIIPYSRITKVDPEPNDHCTDGTIFCEFTNSLGEPYLENKDIEELYMRKL